MKRLLNTLYITTDGAWLRKDGANVVVEIDGKERGRAPVHMLSAIVCLVRVGISPPLMGFCAEEGVAVSFLTGTGRFLARLEGPRSGNVLLRRAQHRATMDATSGLPVARAIVAAKVTNQRTVMRRALRDHGADPEIDGASRRLADVARLALDAVTPEILRGLEGEAARAYFGAFDRLIRRDEPELRFRGRSRRPPLDAPNSLLSFLYALLAGDCRGALESQGLDPQMGFLHRDRPGRASLALDLMEEFRAPLADRVGLTLLNRGQLDVGSFRFIPGGAVFLDDEARRTVIAEWQNRKRTEIRHPFLDEPMAFGLAIQVQAQLLARMLRGDLDAYPAFVWS